MADKLRLTVTMFQMVVSELVITFYTYLFSGCP